MNALAALIVLTGWAILPGIAIAVLTLDRTAERDRAVERFVAVAIVAGYSFWTLASRLVTSIGWLHPATSWLGTLAFGAASVLIVRSRRADLAILFGPPMRRIWGWMGVCLLPTLPILRWLIVDRDTFVNPTPWYYADLVRQTVRAHGTPRLSYEWGHQVRFLDDYPGFTAGTGVAHAVTGGGSLAAEHMVTVLVLFTTALAVALLVRSFGASRFGAFVGVALVMLSGVYASKLLAFRPEAAGYPLMFLVPVLAIDWMEHRRRSTLVVGAIGFAALGQIHGIDLTLCGIFVVAAILVSVVFRPRLQRGRVLGAGLVYLGAMVAVWVVAAGAWGGGLSGVTKVGGLPHIVDGVDPTYLFNALVTRGGDLGSPPSALSIAGRSLQLGLMGIPWGWTTVLVVVAMVVRIVMTGRAHGEARTRSARLLSFAVVAFVAVVVTGFVLSFRWETYVPRRTGLDRMLHLWPILLAIVVGGAIGSVIERCPPRARLALGAIAVVALLGLTREAAGPLANVADQHPPDGQTDVLHRLALDPHALVLMNSYTESYPKLAAGIQPVLNGRAPYTEKHLLARANGLLTDARKFFGSERGPLPCRGIDYVIAASDDDWRLATPNVFGTDIKQLLSNPDLKLLANVPGVTLWQVQPGAATKPTRCTVPPAAK